jgi:hypothetical protein
VLVVLSVEESALGDVDVTPMKLFPFDYGISITSSITIFGLFAFFLILTLVFDFHGRACVDIVWEFVCLCVCFEVNVCKDCQKTHIKERPNSK